MKKKNWIVKARCEVIKEFYFENCTEEQARNMDFSYCIEELELEMPNWEFESIKENKW